MEIGLLGSLLIPVVIGGHVVYYGGRDHSHKATDDTTHYTEYYG